MAQFSFKQTLQGVYNMATIKIKTKNRIAVKGIFHLLS